MKRQDKQREVLLELNERMEAYATDYLIFLVNVGTPTSEQSPSRAKAGDRIEATTAFLARYEPVFPQRIGELVIQLRTAIRIPASAVTRGLDREDLFGISSAVADVTSEIRAELQKQLR